MALQLRSGADAAIQKQKENMEAKKANHWIVRVNSGHGVQFAHVEDENRPATDARILEVMEGPFDTAEEAWYSHHWRNGHINV
jgi:hypothetical protein